MSTPRGSREWVTPGRTSGLLNMDTRRVRLSAAATAFAQSVAVNIGNKGPPGERTGRPSRGLAVIVATQTIVCGTRQDDRVVGAVFDLDQRC
jgi:hypothetical protein